MRMLCRTILYVYLPSELRINATATACILIYSNIKKEFQLFLERRYRNTLNVRTCYILHLTFTTSNIQDGPFKVNLLMISSSIYTMKKLYINV